MRTESGAPPITGFSLNPDIVSVQTSNAGYGSSLDFTVSLFLVAREGAQLFYLASDSGPGVEVTAQVGNSDPVDVNTFPTSSPWGM